jgi:hypothetical protein
MLPYEEKERLWKLIARDWENGSEPMPYIPFDAAEQIHRSKARVKVIAAGNRFAKSLIAAMECAVAMTVPGCHLWICGNTLKICDNEWAYIEHALTKTDLWYKHIAPKIRKQLLELGEPADPDKLRKYVSVIRGKPKSLTINWPKGNASIIEQISYNSPNNYTNLEGVKLNGIVFAEGSKVPKIVWERHLEKRLSDKWGWVCFPSTPKGKDETLYPFFRRGQGSELKVDINRDDRTVGYHYENIEKGDFHIDNAVGYEESYETFQFPGFVNPYYNKKSYDADVRKLFDGELDETTFRERNFGTFESFAGSFYTGLDWASCTRDSSDVEIPSDANIYVTIDPGRASRASVHWVAICKPDEFGVEQWIVFDEMYQKGMWTEKLVEAILERNDKLGVRVDGYVADRTITRDTQHSERSVERTMMDMGIKPLKVPITMPRYTIDRLNHWKPRLMKGQLIIFRDQCPNLISEMEGLEYERPEYANGRTVQRELLAKGDMHALDDITYLVYTRPRWSPEPEVVVVAKKDLPARKGSFAYDWKMHRENNTFMSKIGSY